MSAADISALVIALREGVEMTLLVGIVLAYLSRIGARRAHRFVWAGVGAAAIVSLAFLGVLNALNAEFKGTTEKIYEGATLLLAAAFLTWMILWMLERSRYLTTELQRGVQEALAAGGAAWGLFLPAFFTVAREGVETALLLLAAPGAVTSCWPGRWRRRACSRGASYRRRRSVPPNRLTSRGVPPRVVGLRPPAPEGRTDLFSR